MSASPLLNYKWILAHRSYWIWPYYSRMIYSCLDSIITFPGKGYRHVTAVFSPFYFSPFLHCFHTGTLDSSACLACSMHVQWRRFHSIPLFYSYTNHVSHLWNKHLRRNLGGNGFIFLCTWHIPTSATGMAGSSRRGLLNVCENSVLNYGQNHKRWVPRNLLLLLSCFLKILQHFQIVPQSGDQVFKYMSWWVTFDTQILPVFLKAHRLITIS